MLQHGLYKLLQRKTYTCLSHKFGIYFAYSGLIIVIYSMFHFGEELLEWSRYHYEVAFSVYHDNIASQSFQPKLCSDLPIDVVYTWVNGSDPDLVAQINYYSMKTAVYNNATLKTVCQIGNCFQLPFVVILPKLSKDELNNLSPMYSIQLATKLQFALNSTVLRFDSTNEASQFYSNFNYSNYHQSLIYASTDTDIALAQESSDALILKNLPSNIETVKHLKENLPVSLQPKVKWIYINHENTSAGYILLKEEFIASKVVEEFYNTSGSNKFNIQNNLVSMHLVNYIKFNYCDESMKDIASKSRFEDNEELRYSLRSIEKYAPWVRHVYIVTNGQIPYWLNMDSPFLTVVTHEEIFINKSHLPTFSSPAIETHLHRIPGLSSRFIYFNDDVMFGKEVWPEDFYSHINGYKVYLAWPVPNCAEGCTPSWITDGYCDAACNVSQCNWDGGDCIGPNIKPGVGLSSNNNQNLWQSSSHYCTPGCSNSWLADKFCDQACNKLECGFDVGDCGLSNFDQLHLITSNLINKSVYHLPDGKKVGYIRLKTTFLKVSSAQHDKDQCIRLAAVSNKFQVLTVIFSEICNQTSVQFYVSGTFPNSSHAVNSTVTYQFVLKAFPSRNITLDINQNNKSDNTSHIMETSSKEADVLPLILPSYSPHLKKPQLKSKKKLLDYPSHFTISSVNKTSWPLMFKKRLEKIKMDYDHGYITDDGYKHLVYNLTKLYSLSTPQQSKKISQNLFDVDLNEESHLHVKGDPGATRKDKAGLSELSNDFGMNMRKLNWMESDNMREDDQLIHEGYKSRFHRRKLLDIFGDSLRYVSTLYNQQFGYSQRKVPAHMPHMIDQNIMKELQSQYSHEYDVTSSHRFRHPQDMQFAFSYFYYLMSKEKKTNFSKLFDMFDVDESGVLSDREIRLFAAKVFALPLSLHELTSVEEAIKRCAWKLYGVESNSTLKDNTSYVYKQPLDGLGDLALSETYYDKQMPYVSKEIVLNCTFLTDLLNKTFAREKMFKYKEMDQSEVEFKMIRDNVSTVIGQLDDIRKNRKKFICLNDNINHDLESAATVRAVLRDFYESLFPKQSRFELPPDYRNRFAYISDLRAWKTRHDHVLNVMNLLLICLILCIILSFISDKMSRTCRRFRYTLKRKSLLRCFVGGHGTNPV